MRKVIALLVLIAAAGVANAAIIEVLTNGDLESYADDGFGRDMPTGWGLYTDGGNWGNIPNVEVTTADAYSGSASFALNNAAPSYFGVSLLQEHGHLGADVQLGNHHIGGWFKGTAPAGANIGIDIFGPGAVEPDYGDWWWGGGTDVTSMTTTEWTYFGFDFAITDVTANYNMVVRAPVGSDFMVDGLTLTTDVIPEPATIAFVGIFGGAMLFLRRIRVC